MRASRTRARQIATVAAVAVTGFLCGWQATGIAGGTVIAVALGAGVCPAVFRRGSGTAPRRNR